MFKCGQIWEAAINGKEGREEEQTENRIREREFRLCSDILVYQLHPGPGFARGGGTKEGGARRLGSFSYVLPWEKISFFLILLLLCYTLY